MEKIDDLKQIAINFHKAIITSKRNLPYKYRRYPVGHCLDTSWLLQRYLIESGYSNAKIVQASDYTNLINIQGHAWIMVEDIKVDLTYYQFGRKYGKVIVTCDDELFRQFNKEVRIYDKPYFVVFSQEIIKEYDEIYNIIINKLECILP